MGLFEFIAITLLSIIAGSLVFGGGVGDEQD